MSVSILGTLLATTTFWTLLYLVQAKRKRSKLPPGPPGWPFIGNVLTWPTHDERYLTFTEWRQVYGDLIYVNLAGSDVMLINSFSAAKALFETKAPNFSDRPSMYFTCDLVGWGDLPLFMNYGPAVVGHRRRMLQSIGSKRSIETLESTLRTAALKCLKHVAETPEQLQNHVTRLSNSIIMDIAYGYDVKDDNDKFVRLAEETITEFAHAVPAGTFLVDAIPALNYLPEWFPGAGFKKIAASMIKSRERLLNEPYNFTVQELAAGRAKPSFTATNIAAKELSHEEERLIQTGATMLYIAGSDTTVSSMVTFVLCMLLNPAAQRRAQEEIDKVVGHERLPSLADKPHLPYVSACVKEALRSAPVAPQGMAHVAHADDEHNGYFIPKGTTMIPNIWSMAHDPAIYSDPFSFRPERFLGSNPEPDPIFVFGFGRRICPGRALAQTSMYTFAVHLLTLFDVKPARGPDGQELEVIVEYHGNNHITPRPFPFQCKPRSEKSAATFAAVLHA